MNNKILATIMSFGLLCILVLLTWLVATVPAVGFILIFLIVSILIVTLIWNVCYTWILNLEKRKKDNAQVK
jgi:hypothetical protein